MFCVMLLLFGAVLFISGTDIERIMEFINDRINFKIMKREKMDNILRSLLVAGNIVTVSFDEMKDIRKELNRFVPKIEIEIIKSDFETVSFRELRY